MPRLALVTLTLCCSAACATATWPRVIAVGDGGPAATRHGDWISTYEEAIASIADVMVKDLRLPPPRATINFVRDRDAFRAALQSQGYDAQLATDTAATLAAVSGYRRVLVNDDAMRDLVWPLRVALLAHELTHTLQYEWGGGSRGTSDQWLREGFAEWVEKEVLVALGFTTRAQAQRVLVLRLRELRADRLPALSEMATFPDWVAVAQRYGQEPVYGHAGLAVEFLLERRGADAVIDYFTLFARSPDRAANFHAAFGEEMDVFAASFSAHLAGLLR